MSSWVKVLVISSALCFVLVNIYAQTPIASPQTKDKTGQMIDEAPRGLFQAQPNAASQAGQYRKFYRSKDGSQGHSSPAAR